MKYTVSINEKKQTITVTLADGTQGVAKCCPTDKFDIGTGIELALERAKVAQADRNKPMPSPSPMSVMELVKALEKALPNGEMVVVGNGMEMTDRQKAWLHSLTDCKCSCDCDCEKEYSEEEYDEAVSDAYEEGHSAGYDAGYADALDEVQMNEDDIDKILDRVRDALEEAIH